MSGNETDLSAPVANTENAIVPFDSRHSRSRKRAVGLTEQERQILLAELAEITAELDELQQRAAQIATRVGSTGSARLTRPA